jgi:hypothetical protein
MLVAALLFLPDVVFFLIADVLGHLADRNITEYATIFYFKAHFNPKEQHGHELPITRTVFFVGK